MNIDFRLIKPLRFIDKFRNEVMYKIPSTLLTYKHNIDDSRVYIELEIIHPLLGSKLKVPGITYQKSIKIFENNGLKPPFYADCKVRKLEGTERELVIYRPPDFWATTACSVGDPKNLSEAEIMIEFKKNYSEFAQWFLK